MEKEKPFNPELFANQLRKAKRRIIAKVFLMGATDIIELSGRLKLPCSDYVKYWERRGGK